MYREHSCKRGHLSKGSRGFAALWVVLAILPATAWAQVAPAPVPVPGPKMVFADVVILDHVLVHNRLGAQNVKGMIYALRRDLVDANTRVPCGLNCVPGSTILRPDKRPRPLVLRVSAGDTLVVNFTNLLTLAPNPPVPLPPEANPVLPPLNNQVTERMAGFHVQGMQLVGSTMDDSSYVGSNPNSLALPIGGTAVYNLLAEKEGTFLVTSMGATFGGEATGGNVGIGAFAAVNVEPPEARYYRSQVTEEELRLVTVGHTPTGHPIINYEALYPAVQPWIAEGKVGLPILNMLDGNNNIVHGDLNAIIAGPHEDGTFPPSTYPLESDGLRNPTVPTRLEPFREFTVIFHDEVAATNAFPAWFDPEINPVIAHTTHGVRDGFMINYGSGGIGSEIIANRLGVGPMWDCLDCAYEEFFLTAFTVGDPAMLVDVPANTGLENCGADLAPAACALTGPKATRAFYPDDPSNVHHSYTNDFVKFRNLHAGPKEQHIFHLHNHQWLFNANDDNSNYIDAQGIGPGSGYTYEINFGGSGNRNKTAGDAIFHCHFYPHFAQGMWEMWRIYDTLQTGTELAVSQTFTGFHAEAFDLWDGTPANNGAFDVFGTPRLNFQTTTRALPDGEILVGTPIPAVVPLPGKPMAPVPAPVTVVVKNTNPGVDDVPDAPSCALNPTGPTCGIQQLPESSQANVLRVDADGDGVLDNPGYPFWVAGVDCGGPIGRADVTGCRDGIVGQRPTTPPLDMLTVSDAIALKITQGNPLFQHPGFVQSAGGFDGGLPRHALDGFVAVEPLPGTGRLPIAGIVTQHQTRFDFRKDIHKAKPVYYPEQGTDLEQAAMAHHAIRQRPTCRPDGTCDAPLTPVKFLLNGAPPVPGAPYNEPCVDDEGDLFIGPGQFFAETPGSFFTASPQGFPASEPRKYKAANIELDAVFNKVGYHFPQQRIISLWRDIPAYLATTVAPKAPEPFVIRMNTFDCTQYYHSNLVPREYQLDDYQVRTPTDIIGQHIHLPKWDLTTADGSANGWNYEDGTLSPQAVHERVMAINTFNLTSTNPVPTLPKPDGTGGGLVILAEATNPDPAFPPHPDALGARTTLQRWFADPVVNTRLEDRGLGIIFTHDHYGPSTHQQIGLYATVLTEPAGSTWRHNETGALMATRDDGGPTSWQAVIQPLGVDAPGMPASATPFREFYFEFSDFQHAYEAEHKGVLSSADQEDIPEGAPDPNAFRFAINPSYRLAQPFPDIMHHPAICPGGLPRPCPEAISADDVGMLVVNYRNEPVGLRVYDPNAIGPDLKPGRQAAGVAGDLAHALESRSNRAIAPLNTALGNTPYLALTNDVGNGDPFTPMMRIQFGDEVHVKIQAGGHEHEHNATILGGVKWLQGGSGHGEAPNSGWRNSQNDGISEQFTFTADSLVIPDVQQLGNKLDLAYSVDASQDGWWSGMWGLIRAYNQGRTDLVKLNNGFVAPVQVTNKAEFNGACPLTAPVRIFDVTAVLANNVLGSPLGVGLVPPDLSATMHVGAPVNPNGGTLVYNPRQLLAHFQGPLHDPTAIMYVRTSDLCLGRLCPGVPVEPLVLRAAAGDCIEITVRNELPAVVPDLAGYTTLLQMVLRDRNDPLGTTSFNNNLIRPSSEVGLVPQLVELDASRDLGAIVGTNAAGQQLAGPGQSVTYRWYAGHFDAIPDGTGNAIVRAMPVEYGGINLRPADVIKQGQKGMIGSLIIEPQGSTWIEDPNQRASATVFRSDGTVHRDHSVMFQKAINQRYGKGQAVENIAGEGGPIGPDGLPIPNNAPGGFPQDSHDAGQAAINYRTEPAWYRFGKRANSPFEGVLGTIGNAHMMYSNALAGGDPATPVFTAQRGQEVRMHVLEATGSGRGTTFDLHGHLWQRDPYLARTVPDHGGLPRFVPSQTIGVNPLAMYLGGQESVTPSAHFNIFLPQAGGVNGVTGDYLLRDHASFGNTDGLWALFRVLP